MKRIFIFLLLLIVSVHFATAQDLWRTDAEEAFRLAEEQGLPVMLVFSGSDWCKPCIQLTKEVFETDRFQEFAENEVILLRVDFPRSKRNQLEPDLQSQNNQLAERWNPNGEFPLVVVLASDQSVLFTTGYRSGGPEVYIQYLAEELSHHESNH